MSGLLVESYEMEEKQHTVVAEGSSLLVGDNGVETNSARRQQRIRSMWVLLLVASCVAALSAYSHVLKRSRSDTASDNAAAASDEHGQAEAPMQAAAVTPLGSDMSKCKLASCTGSGCAWDSAPYLCTDGASAGGCAADASTWAPENGGCNAFCDLSGCSDTLKRAEAGGEGADDLPRHCGQCNDDQCSAIAKQGSQACGNAAPYMCLSGAATWGCADTELAWASAPATTCGECCDVGGCAGDR